MWRCGGARRGGRGETSHLEKLPPVENRNTSIRMFNCFGRGWRGWCKILNTLLRNKEASCVFLTSAKNTKQLKYNEKLEENKLQSQAREKHYGIFSCEMDDAQIVLYCKGFKGNMYQPYWLIKNDFILCASFQEPILQTALLSMSKILAPF